MRRAHSGLPVRPVDDSHGEHRNRSGAILPLVAVTLVAMMGVTALAIDGGAIQQHRRLAQNAADAGALAGAQEILRTHSQSVAFAAADTAARRNGYVDGVNGAHVIV